MKLVKCIEERVGFSKIKKGLKYWMNESSIWKDGDGDEYATFYSFHIPNETYKIGQFKTSHFELEHDCTECIYSSYPKDCKRICMVVAGKEELV